MFLFSFSLFFHCWFFHGCPLRMVQPSGLNFGFQDNPNVLFHFSKLTSVTTVDAPMTREGSIQTSHDGVSPLLIACCASSGMACGTYRGNDLCVNRTGSHFPAKLVFENNNFGRHVCVRGRDVTIDMVASLSQHVLINHF